jgi:hypothetical protein
MQTDAQYFGDHLVFGCGRIVFGRHFIERDDFSLTNALLELGKIAYFKRKRKAHGCLQFLLGQRAWEDRGRSAGDSPWLCGREVVDAARENDPIGARRSLGVRSEN